MSGWDNDTTSAGNGWGATEQASGGLEDTSDMQAALDSTEEKKKPPPLPFESRDAPIQPWQKPTAYDYAAFGAEDAGIWEGNLETYHWDGEEGELGPEHPVLERMLFGDPAERQSEGIDFSKIAMISVMQEGSTRIAPIMSFDTAGLHPAIRKNIELCGYSVPTPIQKYCIPAIKMGHDVIAIAQTGLGKTAAYLIPILNHLMGKAKKLAAPRPEPVQIDAGIAPPVRAEPLVVIVVPARELAVQIFNEARKLCYRSMLRPCVVYGGGPIRDQINQLQKGCDILVASPGRLIDMMDRPHILTLRRVKYMVIDEADEMLHPDWEEEFNKILTGGEQEEGNVKYMLFSATFPVTIRKLAKTYLAPDYFRIRVGRIGSTHENIKQDIIWVDHTLKKKALIDLIFSLEPGRTMIFVNNKRTADEIDDFLFHKGMPVTSMHADRTQREREDALRAFRSGKTPIMVATGVTARGIDVKNVRYVINFDLPSAENGGIVEYTHRIGRTGRIGHRGMAVSFYTERDESLAEDLTKLLLETHQEIPDFLQSYVPEGDVKNLKFEPDSDEDDSDAGENGGTGGGDGWGAGGGEDSKPSTGGDGWGSGGGAAGGADGDTWGSNEATGTAAGGDSWGSGAAQSSGDGGWGTGDGGW